MDAMLVARTAGKKLFEGNVAAPVFDKKTRMTILVSQNFPVFRETARDAKAAAMDRYNGFDVSDIYPPLPRKEWPVSLTKAVEKKEAEEEEKREAELASRKSKDDYDDYEFDWED